MKPQMIDLELFVSHLRDAVVISDKFGKIILSNPVFNVLFLRGIREKNVFNLFKNNPTVQEKFEKTLNTRGSYLLRRILIRLNDNQTRNFNIETFPLTQDNGDLLGLCMIFQDLESAIPVEERERQLDRINYLKTIAAGLAHEIRNPLSGIKGASQLLSKSLKENDDLKEYAFIIEKEVVRVDKLLKDLLHFTKPRSLTKKSTNINRVLRDIILLQKEAYEHKIEIIEEFDPSLPELNADDQVLKQVFLNLIKNAQESLSETKNPKIIIKSRIVTDVILKKGTKKQQMIRVDVTDNGPGINEDQIEQIFYPFYTTKAKGTGLGLAISYQMIEEHGGTISVKSSPGLGATFSVMIPV